jgi:hypothetical protein
MTSDATYALRRNEHEDSFYCFRCWEIRRLGVSEKIIKILQASQSPKLPVAKANMRSHKEVTGKLLGEKSRKLEARSWKLTARS